LHELTSLQASRALLCAAAAAPPLMPPVKIQGLDAFDGGYSDNAPIAARTAAKDKETFILLTRHYPERNPLFIHEGRTYLQPSRPVPVSTWDCTAKASVMDAFTLGYEDADRLQWG
jgi:predicted acylesterase/phospholipase RssA